MTLLLKSFEFQNIVYSDEEKVFCKHCKNQVLFSSDIYIDSLDIYYKKRDLKVLPMGVIPEQTTYFSDKIICFDCRMKDFFSSALFLLLPFAFVVSDKYNTKGYVGAGQKNIKRLK